MLKLCVFTLLGAFLAEPSVCSPQVRLGATTLHGVSVPGLKQEFFGGIPFAQAPTGDLRFAPPVVKFSPGGSTFEATQFGAACAQIGSGQTPSGKTLPGFNITDVSEDCLSINVFRPAGLQPTSRLPVMAWVFGGGFSGGAASQYNGSAIVAASIARGTPLIYVNFNYRLGVFGFPTGDEAAKRGALNLGLKDITAALEWVQHNIETFGGDSQKVTVFGESAGAIAIAQLFLSPDLDKLARGAIFESGSAGSQGLLNASFGEDSWQGFTAAVPECEGVAIGDQFGCLRAASFEELMNAVNIATLKSGVEFPFVPVIDGPGGVIPDFPSKLFARGQFARLPFISGTNSDEGTLFTPFGVNSTEEVQAFVTSVTTSSNVAPALEAQVRNTLLELYPDVPADGAPFNTGNNTFGLSSQFKRFAALFTDIGFVAVRRAWTTVASQNGVKVYAYLLTDPQLLSPPFLGVTHGSDIQYIYGEIPNGLIATTNGASAINLSRNMMDYWISFANSLDPNDKHGNVLRTHWGQFMPNSEVILQLNGDNLTMIPDTFRQQQVAFINANPVTFNR